MADDNSEVEPDFEEDFETSDIGAVAPPISYIGVNEELPDYSDCQVESISDQYLPFDVSDLPQDGEYFEQYEDRFENPGDIREEMLIAALKYDTDLGERHIETLASKEDPSSEIEESVREVENTDLAHYAARELKNKGYAEEDVKNLDQIMRNLIPDSRRGIDLEEKHIDRAISKWDEIKDNNQFVQELVYGVANTEENHELARKEHGYQIDQ